MPNMSIEKGFTVASAVYFLFLILVKMIYKEQIYEIFWLLEREIAQLLYFSKKENLLFIFRNTEWVSKQNYNIDWFQLHKNCHLCLAI